MWRRYPALFVGLHLLIGMSLIFYGTLWALLPLLAVREKRISGLLLVILAAIYAHVGFREPADPVEGLGWLKVEALRRNAGPFGAQTQVVGRLKGFEVDGERVAWGVPVRVYHAGELPPMDSHYAVRGQLVDGRLRVKEWYPIADTRSLAQWRYDRKEGVRKGLEGHFKDSEVGALCAGLVTGDLADGGLLFDFGRLGLQHLMAISGFHFSLLAALLGLLLRPFLPTKLSSLLLVGLLSGYFFFMGASPSIQRAYVMAAVGLGGWILGRRSSPLNALGLALVVGILWDPPAIRTLGFQFSFGATAALLIFYNPMDQWLQRLFGSYDLKEARSMSLWDQHGLLLWMGLRRMIALSLAVHVVVLPLTLVHFGCFPMLALFYNLFFPLLIALALLALPFLFLTGGMFLEEGLLRFAIDLCRHAPPLLAMELKLQLPAWLVVCFLTVCLYLNLEKRESGVVSSATRLRLGLGGG